MAKQPIQPKPTTYQGQLFRSRLEARWAVYLDNTPNILTWKYEPHVIKSKNGWTYTPDFLVTFYVDGHSQRLYLECKPTFISVDYDKFLLQIVKETKYGVLLLMCNMYDDDTIYTKLYLNGKGYQAHIGELFVGVEDAYIAALNYRFDLKGH